MPLFYRFGADDMLEGGLTLQEAKLAAQHLEQAGVDVMDVSGGIGGDGHGRLLNRDTLSLWQKGLRKW